MRNGERFLWYSCWQGYSSRKEVTNVEMEGTMCGGEIYCATTLVGTSLVWMRCCEVFNDMEHIAYATVWPGNFRWKSQSDT